MALIRQSRPEHGPGFQVKILQSFKLFPLRSEAGRGETRRFSEAERGETRRFGDLDLLHRVKVRGQAHNLPRAEPQYGTPNHRSRQVVCFTYYLVRTGAAEGETS